MEFQAHKFQSIKTISAAYIADSSFRPNISSQCQLISTGEWVTAQVQITAHHKGYFEFRLCPWDKPSVSVATCKNWYVLHTASPEDTRWILPENGNQIYSVPIKLPDGVECNQCVLQWRYHTGNSWGCDNNGACCVGCGDQEEFYGCADISIGASSTEASSTAKTITTSSPLLSSIMSTTTTTPTTTATKTTTTVSSSEAICETNETGRKMKDCTSFYTCLGVVAYEYQCSLGTVWNQERQACDHPYNVPPDCVTKGV
uniref:uncharacterized protein LOC120341779 n=1 Tax=Styela clava TaxID=7725 RepID=UPI001939F428|nr:uncharacterized protein LOC120341779 [Styela clava]